MYGSTDTMQALIDAGAKLDAADEVSSAAVCADSNDEHVGLQLGNTALMEAAEAGQVAALELLVGAQADVNWLNKVYILPRLSNDWLTAFKQ